MTGGSSTISMDSSENSTPTQRKSLTPVVRKKRKRGCGTIRVPIVKLPAKFRRVSKRLAKYSYKDPWQYGVPQTGTPSTDVQRRHIDLDGSHIEKEVSCEELVTTPPSTPSRKFRKMVRTEAKAKLFESKNDSAGQARSNFKSEDESEKLCGCAAVEMENSGLCKEKEKARQKRRAIHRCLYSSPFEVQSNRALKMVKKQATTTKAKNGRENRSKSILSTTPLFDEVDAAVFPLDDEEEKFDLEKLFKSNMTTRKHNIFNGLEDYESVADDKKHDQLFE